MFNLISTLVVVGAVSASGMAHMIDLEKYSDEVVSAYVASADKRFADYDKMIPGLIEWPDQSKQSVELKGPIDASKI